MTYSPLPFLGGGEQRRYLQNTKKRKQQCFRFCLLFWIYSLLSFFFLVHGSFLLLVIDPAVVGGVLETRGRQIGDLWVLLCWATTRDSDAVQASWFLWWEEPVKGTPAGKVSTASPKLVVEGIGYWLCCWSMRRRKIGKRACGERLCWWPAMGDNSGEGESAMAFFGGEVSGGFVCRQLRFFWFQRERGRRFSENL